MPESRRVLDVLWDDVMGVRTTTFGIVTTDDTNRRTEKLFRRVQAGELHKAVLFTVMAKRISSGEDVGEDSKFATQIMEYWSGEKLSEAIEFTESVKKKLGSGFIDESLLQKSRSTVKSLDATRQRNTNALVMLMMPILPIIVVSGLLKILSTCVQMKYHNIGNWMKPIEAAAKGEQASVMDDIIDIFLGHLLFDAISVLSDGLRERAKNKLDLAVRSGVLQAMLRQDYEYFQKTPPGMLQDRLNRDADRLNSNLISFPLDMLERATRILGCTLFLWVSAPVSMCFSAIAPLAPVMLIQYFITCWHIKRDERSRKMNESASSTTGEVLREVKTVRQFAMERQEASRYVMTLRQLFQNEESMFLYGSFMGMMFGMSVYGGLVFTLYLGVDLVRTGAMSASTLIDIVFKLNFDVVFTLRDFVQKLPEIVKLMQPLSRISELLASDPKIEPKGEPTGLRPAKFEGRIEFQDVYWSPPNDPRKAVLQGLSFTVEPGQKVALIGHTGCGKSSTMGLLQRLYLPVKGTIKVDGRPIQDYNLHYLRSKIVIVDQFTVLFGGNVRDNITYGLTNASDEDVHAAIKDAVADFVYLKPDQLMTECTGFSGGERQRLAIARAIVRKPDVILLDEATASLDVENEALVQAALDKLAKKGSALVIAHRMSTIKDSDKIVVLDGGRNVEEGTHSELLDRQVTKHDVPPPEPLDLDRAQSDEMSAPSMPGPPGPPLHLMRAKTAQGTVMSAERDKNVTYKKLWETSMGSQDKMTVKQLQEKIEKMEADLVAMKDRAAKMRSVREDLVSTKGGSFIRDFANTHEAPALARSVSATRRQITFS
eukprot:TRINITY_DN16132_c0_g1_i1.p1 TRINITY_DN16132_c0_g1~~TRINITY_DN16132_c0_g1_i1.p1  ORF type:complete len:942 (-),score=173.02 TRINITY_DN16132_c0_g1_i1:53-2530(-)